MLLAFVENFPRLLLNTFHISYEANPNAKKHTYYCSNVAWNSTSIHVILTLSRVYTHNLEKNQKQILTGFPKNGLIPYMQKRFSLKKTETKISLLYYSFSVTCLLPEFSKKKHKHINISVYSKDRM